MEELLQIWCKQLSLKPWSSCKSTWNLFNSQEAIKILPVMCPCVSVHYGWRELIQNRIRTTRIGIMVEEIYKAPELRIGNSHKPIHFSLNDLYNLCKLRFCYLKLLGNFVWKPVLSFQLLPLLSLYLFLKEMLLIHQPNI